MQKMNMDQLIISNLTPISHHFQSLVTTILLSSFFFFLAFTHQEELIVVLCVWLISLTIIIFSSTFLQITRFYSTLWADTPLYMSIVFSLSTHPLMGTQADSTFQLSHIQRDHICVSGLSTAFPLDRSGWMIEVI